jgi:DNA polymerase III alpha subunit
LDGASAPDELVARAVELGLSGLAVTDHNGLYGVVRFAVAAQEAGLRPVIGVEIEMADAAVPDLAGIAIPGRRPPRAGHGAGSGSSLAGMEPLATPSSREGLPARPRPARARLPGHRDPVKEDLRGIGEGQRGPHLVLLARNTAGYRSLCRLVSRANLAGTKSMPRFSHELLAANTEGLVALSGCREGEISRRLRAGDRVGARAAAERYARLFAGGGRSLAGGGAGGDSPATAAFFLELQHHLLPDDDWLVAETARLAGELGLPVVVTNDVHYAYPEGREMQDVLTAIRHGRTLDELRDLRRPDGESYLKSAAELMEMGPAGGVLSGVSGTWSSFANSKANSLANSLANSQVSGRQAAHTAVSSRDFSRSARTGSGTQNADASTSAAWAQGIGNAGELAASCSVDLGFERYRFPGFPVPKGHTPFSYLEELCHEGARRRYHPISSPVVKQLAHELDVIEKTGLAEFFLICWDLMRFAREGGIPAQGRGSAANSIVAYVLGITRVDPIRHNLLFERFINEGRTSYPDIDIDFSSERREEVIQYIYGRYGPEHTGMVCNLVTYRARSAVREVGYALGFPRPLVDRVAKALETYDSVMVRRDLEADGGFGQFFADTVEREVEAVGAAGAAETTTEHGLTDRMGQLNHARGGRIGDGVAGSGAAHSGPGAAHSGSGAAHSGPVVFPYIDPGNAMEKKVAAMRGAPASSDAEGAEARNWGRVEVESGTSAGHGTPESAESRSRRTAEQRSGTSAFAYHSPHRYKEEGMGAVAAVPQVAAAAAAVAAAAAAAAPISDLGGGSATEQERRLARKRPVPSDDEGGPGDSPASIVWLATEKVAAASPAPRPGSAAALPHWERWLAFCARIDGFPRHLSIHSGGMLVTAAPLIDIAPLERATMPDRVVVQFDKRDVETLKLIKLDLLGLGMLAAIDETLQLIERDCAATVDLDRLPEDVPEVFEMLRAADTVGVFQVESRAQMQTLPKSRPANLDDLVVEVAIIRPGPIQGNAVHPYLRRRQGLEPVTYLHPSLEPVLRETLGVILYQEQVMNIAITVAGFTPGESDGFRRAMGTWRSSKEMEKLHQRFVDGCRATNGLTDEQAEELFRRVAAFASFGFAKSHAAAFARTAYESAFLKLFYPAQFTVGLINAQPMGFYPVEVLINDARRHGVAVLPVDVNASTYKTSTEWVGPARQRPVDSSGCVVPSAEARRRWTPEQAAGYGIRLGLQLVKGIGDEHAERLEAELERGPYATLADVVARTELPEEVIERLIRAGALDTLGRPRRELLWQLREVMGATRGRVGERAGGPTRGRVGEGAGGPTPGRTDGRKGKDGLSRIDARSAASGGRSRTGAQRPRAGGVAGARPLDLRLPPTPAPELPPLTERERLGDSYAVLSLDARRQVVSLFRPSLNRLGVVTNASLSDRGPGPVKLGGLVVTRQHPMTARGTVFLALEDETGMVNVTLWPDVWARLRGVVRRHALLYVDGTLQREANVVNVIARDIKPLPEVAETVEGPDRLEGVRALGYSGLRRG